MDNDKYIYIYINGGDGFILLSSSTTQPWRSHQESNGTAKEKMRPLGVPMTTQAFNRTMFTTDQQNPLLGILQSPNSKFSVSAFEKWWPQKSWR